ncbi:unnamed protein product [Cutaneotrichosporon oleaginosum]
MKEKARVDVGGRKEDVMERQEGEHAGDCKPAYARLVAALLDRRAVERRPDARRSVLGAAVAEDVKRGVGSLGVTMREMCTNNDNRVRGVSKRSAANVWTCTHIPHVATLIPGVALTQVASFDPV